MILIFSDSPRCDCANTLHFICKFTFIQAGLIMYTKDFTLFVFEVEEKILDMPYFYSGKHSFPVYCILK